MKEDLKILKEVFTKKNMFYGILFNVIAFSSMYLWIELLLFIKFY